MEFRSRINSVIFLVLLCAGFWYLDQVFATEHKFHNTKMAFARAVDSSDVDVLFIGSSHVFTSTIPGVVDSYTKANSFNFGSDGLRLELSSVVVEEALKKCKPKLVAIEVFRGSVAEIETDVSKGFQLRALDFVSNLTYRKLKRVSQIYQPREYLAVYSSLIRNHKNWPTLNYKSLYRGLEIDPRKNFFDRGYMGVYSSIHDSLAEDFKFFRDVLPQSSKADPYFRAIHIEEIKYLKELSENHDFELLFYTAPDLWYPWVNKQLYLELDSLVNQYNIPYLNENEYYEQMDLKIQDFKDASHLNFYGAIKSSKLLGDFIYENFDLPDRSADSEWQHIQRDFTNRKLQAIEGKLMLRDSAMRYLLPELSFSNFEVRQILGRLQFSFYFNDNSSKYNGKYNLGIQVFPKKGYEYQRALQSKGKNRGFDNFSFELKNITRPFVKVLNSEISQIERVRIFLFDANGYNGVIGNPVIIDDF